MLKVLKTLHANGILHRDIKPNNVIVSKEGHYYLIDFGVSSVKAQQKQQQNSMEQAPPTTPISPHYTPVEQMHGNATQRSDFFSLAITCYFCLFKDKEPPKQYQFQDPQLSVVLEKMAQPDEKDRYETAEEILATLGPPPSQGQPSPSL